MKMSKKAITTIVLISVIGTAVTVSYTVLLFKHFDYMNTVLAYGEAFASLGKYEDQQGFADVCIQDGVAYYKFYYNEDVLPRLEHSSYFSKIEPADKDRINIFVINYNDFLEFTDFKDEFDFDLDKFNSDDYFYIDNDGFDSYDVWCFDTESLTLYYFHSNI